jgi:hypothetical protein
MMWCYDRDRYNQQFRFLFCYYVCKHFSDADWKYLTMLMLDLGKITLMKGLMRWFRCNCACFQVYGLALRLSQWNNCELSLISRYLDKWTLPSKPNTHQQLLPLLRHLSSRQWKLHLHQQSDSRWRPLRLS